MHICLPIILFASLTASLSGCYLDTSPGHEMPGLPHVFDDRVRVSLVVEDPEIVTPIGIAISAADEIYVLESHTHTPPDDYSGPKADRIKVLRDVDSDGSMDSIAVFAEGIIDGMNLTFGPDGHLYVVSSKAVTRYPDYDKDGRPDDVETILRLAEPGSVYDHAGLLGIAATPDGWLYISRGNTGSRAWRLEGADGSFVQGYGDGGNVIRCRLDGSDVQEVATGFWNPFDLAFDGSGHLLLVDNDPDSRGPNRLIDVVKGGDYGYKSLYGGSGIHPFVAWNGELPGTLPYVLGIGEAPSGMLHTRHTSLPAEYKNSFLISIWEESKVIAVRIEEKDGVLTGSAREVLQGDSAFRPISFAVDSRGRIYFTDWVVREYPNHGKGRLWMLDTHPEAGRLNPLPPYAQGQKTKAVRHREYIENASKITDLPLLKEALLSEDPYLRAVARHALSRGVFREWVRAQCNAASADLRLQAALILMNFHLSDASSLVRTLLEDSDERVRQVALIWAGRKGIDTVLPDVEALLYNEGISGELFDTYLATVKHLQPDYVEAYSSRSETTSSSILRVLPEGYLNRILEDKRLPEDIRALALSRVAPDSLRFELLEEALLEGGTSMQDAAIFFLMQYPDEGGADLLASFLSDESKPIQARADAILALTSYRWTEERNGLNLSEDDYDSELVPLLVEHVRRARASNSAPGLKGYVSSLGFNALDDQLRIWERSVGGTSYLYPVNQENWLAAIKEGGHARRGRRVFYSQQAQCSSCHMHSGWGGTVGPDLSHVGASKSKAQILKAILDPSSEISPEWQGWYVKTTSGQYHYGRQIDVGLNSVELMNLEGVFERYSDVAEYGISPVSLMPQGLHLQLTITDMQDLVTFLAGSN